ncbi:ImmA/IrrE family metallo-endopeptidase [Bradyrhizobium sp. U531]|uniref:ImmA/IrrE family metallo-endopeptidase n=1 Tax=Bradyrhizobium sp. U531 TaxID=3053458 RepID=UPI003F435554
MRLDRGAIQDADSIRELARLSANSLRERNLFGDDSPTVPQLLKRLDLELREVRGLQVRGLLTREREIVIRQGLPDINRRFVILHEIGHAVFFRDHPEVANHLSQPLHEEFAFHFALSLIQTRQDIEAILARFPNIASPIDLLKEAQRSRLPLAIFWNIPRLQPHCLADTDRLWLRCSFAANRYSGKDPKMRIISAQYDRNRWFIPENKGLAGVIGDISWLSDIRIGEEVLQPNVLVKLQKFGVGTQTKFVSTEAKASIRATSIRASRSEGRVGFLLIVSMRSESEIEQPYCSQ